ncbi:nicotinate-nucleotide diphosphorylase (carboxylating) [Vulcanimicrobium alpinum]|uniref:Probable nicotinate-nucleotide pyrophosphorylase [carboxylating] n=1 Tax=Vulcanimicrobium alpinum TaxID=3016050 RepID=A0AAN2CAC5_UNVUL|nr:carboxylating nicotinate-nucleotide diphosphorylase [Vulcanimicrobium alpinum]BDE06778.1 nicotinate-nucleotide diphosphorylase (carboxylating) [Vulcanimicrobium alpinum]
MIALLVDDVVRAALREDLSRAGDLTTDAIVPPGALGDARVVAREAGVVSGVFALERTFAVLDPKVAVAVRIPDGGRVEPGSVVVVITGPLRSILTGERTALNLLCRLSGIATATARLVDAVAGTRVSIADTRKTTPGLRALEKAAVRDGGGSNHRFGLDDAILIKDNHVAIAGGIAPAIEAARRRAGHLVKIEIEVDTLDQLDEALAARADIVLLDNFAVGDLREAVRRTAGRALLEASGRIDAATVRAVAETGVDLISSGALTHSARILDLGLDIG